MNTLSDFKKNTEKIFEIAKDKDLTPSEINLLMVINLLSDNEKEVCFASNKTLAQKVNLSANRITYILKDLAQKGLITLNYAPKGQTLNINGKNYVSYRLIKLNLPIITDNDTPIIVDNETSSLQTMINKTKSKTTKNNKTNSLSSKTMDRQCKDKPKKTIKRDKTHSKLFDYAMSLIENKKSIGNKKAYAFTIVKNWLKAGLNTVEKVEEDKAKNSQRKSSKPVFVEKVPNWNSKPQVKSETELKKLNNDIDRLMAKLCN